MLILGKLLLIILRWMKGNAVPSKLLPSSSNSMDLPSAPRSVSPTPTSPAWCFVLDLLDRRGQPCEVNRVVEKCGPAVVRIQTEQKVGLAR